MGYDLDREGEQMKRAEHGAESNCQWPRDEDERSSPATKFMAPHHAHHRSSASLSESNDGRQSIDSDRSVETSSPVVPVGVNGHTSPGDEDDDSNFDPVAKLQRELERTREEKDTLAAQYRNLLAKLTTMRTTLGNKLKQDAVRSAHPPVCVLL